MVVANVGSEIAQTFYNSMLPELSPPDQIGSWSGLGWGLGYIAGILGLVVLLFGFVQRQPPLFGLDPATAENVRIAGPSCALWLLLFSLPLFLIVPDKTGAGLPLGAAVRTGLRTLGPRSWPMSAARQHLPNSCWRGMIYQDGLNTLFAFGGIYAAGTFGMDTAAVIMFGITSTSRRPRRFPFRARRSDRLQAHDPIALVGLLICGTVAADRDRQDRVLGGRRCARHLHRPGRLGQPHHDGAAGTGPNSAPRCSASSH